jgi:hypothetical protein
LSHMGVGNPADFGPSEECLGHFPIRVGASQER